MHVVAICLCLVLTLRDLHNEWYLTTASISTSAASNVHHVFTKYYETFDCLLSSVTPEWSVDMTRVAVAGLFCIVEDIQTADTVSLLNATCGIQVCSLDVYFSAGTGSSS